MGRNSDLPFLLDFCKTFEIADLKRWKCVKENMIVSTVITFKSFNNEAIKVSMQVCNYIGNPYIELQYFIDGKAIAYRIYFELFPSNLGKGVVWYFICPRTGKRCKRLYLIGNYFCHRSACTSGKYQTQTLGAKDKFLIRQFDKMTKANEAKRQLNSSNFKKYNNGKPTKRYLRVLRQIEEGGGISERALLLA